MKLWYNIPFGLILVPMLMSSLTLILSPSKARLNMLLAPLAGIVFSAILLVKTLPQNTIFTYALGGFGAPFGNELRSGPLEAVIALIFCTVLFLSLLGGYNRICVHIQPHRQNLYSVMVLLLMASLMAEVFTNDMFTGYVFIEIMTIAAGGLVAARSNGRTLFGATKYMIMNMLGSGLFLMGLSILYCLTGELLMSDIHEKVAVLYKTGLHRGPLMLSIALISIGLAAKSALYPFHSWLPDAYGTATPATSAMLSSLVSKAYIFLYIKIIVRVVGMDVMEGLGLGKLLIVYAMVGIIMGSIDAIMEKKLRGMIAYSSVAQIGYIYLGIAINTRLGIAAAVFHIITHALAKSLLFLSGDRLIGISDGDAGFHELRGAGYRSILNGILFTIGSCSIVGIPLLGGFASKVYLADACLELSSRRSVAALVVLALSTALNAAYFLITVITLYEKPTHEYTTRLRHPFASTAALVTLAALIILVGFDAFGLYRTILTGIHCLA